MNRNPFLNIASLPFPTLGRMDPANLITILISRREPMIIFSYLIIINRKLRDLIKTETRVCPVHISTSSGIKTRNQYVTTETLIKSFKPLD